MKECNLSKNQMTLTVLGVSPLLCTSYNSAKDKNGLKALLNNISNNTKSHDCDPSQKIVLVKFCDQNTSKGALLLNEYEISSLVCFPLLLPDTEKKDK